MVFENKLLPHAAEDKENITFEEFCRWNQIEVQHAGTLNDTDSDIREIAAVLIQYYTRVSDLLSFISAGLSKTADTLNYKLIPPCTTSKLECTYVLGLLVKAGILADASYSSITNSFWITPADGGRYTIKELLGIGLCSFIASGLRSSVPPVHNAYLKIGGCMETANAAFINDKTLVLLHIVIAAGLEADISSHPQQLSRLKRKIFSAPKTHCDIENTFIVTPYVASLLPESKSIVSIDKLSSLLPKLQR